MSAVFNQIKAPLLLVFLSMLLFFIFVKFLGPIPFTVNSITTTKNDLFTVEGVGEVTGAPSTASFSVGVTKTATTVETAQNQVNTAVNAITSDLKALGIDEKDIKTSNYNVNPNVDYLSGTQRTTGYTVSVTMDVKATSTDEANKALDSATANGANTISGVNFVLSDEDQEKLESEARKKAVADAKQKAEAISKDVGIRLGRVVNVYVNPDLGTPLPYAQELSAARNAGDMAKTELQSGENIVRVSVSLSYETL